MGIRSRKIIQQELYHYKTNERAKNKLDKEQHIVLIKRTKDRIWLKDGQILKVITPDDGRSILLRYRTATQGFSNDQIAMSMRSKRKLFGELPESMKAPILFKITPAKFSALCYWIKHDQIPGVLKSVGVIGGFITVIAYVIRLILSLF